MVNLPRRLLDRREIKKRTGWYNLGVIIKFVLKNIWAKKLRTLLIIISVMLSSALYFATEALSGTVADMFVERMRLYFGTADLMIYPTQDSPSSFFTQTVRNSSPLTLNISSVRSKPAAL